MTASIYQQLLVRSWQIAWRHKQLWIFGFFAAFAGFGGVSEIFLRAFQRAIDLAPAASLFGWPLAFFPTIATWRALVVLSPYPLTTAVILSFLTAAALVAFAWIVIVSIAALVRSCDRLGRDAGDIHFSDSFRLGQPRFWPLLGINFTAKLITLLFSAFTGISLLVLVGESTWTNAAFYASSFIVFSALTVAISIVAIFATMESAVNGLGPVAAARRGAALFAGNWLIGLETAVIVLGANLIFGLIILAALAVLAIPVIFLSMAMMTIGSRLAVLSLSTGAMALVIFAAAALGSFMTVFQTAFWTLVWQEVSGRKRMSWLARAFIRLAGLSRKK